jgi:hypothetical protein
MLCFIRLFFLRTTMVHLPLVGMVIRAPEIRRVLILNTKVRRAALDSAAQEPVGL